jgi:transportin-3
MAANGVASQAFAPVLAAVDAMQSNADRTQKSKANDFLDTFQKTVSIQSNETARKYTY